MNSRSKEVKLPEKLTPELLREILVKHGLSQEEFACRIGVYQSRVSKWLNGKNAVSKAYEYRIRKEFL